MKRCQGLGTRLGETVGNQSWGCAQHLERERKGSSAARGRSRSAAFVVKLKLPSPSRMPATAQPADAVVLGAPAWGCFSLCAAKFSLAVKLPQEFASMSIPIPGAGGFLSSVLCSRVLLYLLPSPQILLGKAEAPDTSSTPLCFQLTPLCNLPVCSVPALGSACGSPLLPWNRLFESI